MTWLPLTVRVVPTRVSRSLAWLVATAGGVGLTAYTWTHGPREPYALFFGLIWTCGLLLSRRRSPYLASVESDSAGLRIGRERVPCGAKASIVEAELGASLALMWSAGEIFVETSTVDDAHAIARTIHAEIVEEITLRRSTPMLHILKVIAAVCGVVAALVLASGAFGLDPFGGVVLFGAIATLLHVAESAVNGRVSITEANAESQARGSIKEHVLLHVHRVAVKREPERRVRVLVRAAEPTREWLNRIDAVASDAYRSELPSQDELWRLLKDSSGPIYERLAAARLLMRRYGAAFDDIAGAVEPDALQHFVEIGHDDRDRVATAIEHAGPVFRA